MGLKLLGKKGTPLTTNPAPSDVLYGVPFQSVDHPAGSVGDYSPGPAITTNPSPEQVLLGVSFQSADNPYGTSGTFSPEINTNNTTLDAEAAGILPAQAYADSLEVLAALYFSPNFSYLGLTQWSGDKLLKFLEARYALGGLAGVDFSGNSLDRDSLKRILQDADNSLNTGFSIVLTGSNSLATVEGEITIDLTNLNYTDSEGSFVAFDYNGTVSIFHLICTTNAQSRSIAAPAGNDYDLDYIDSASPSDVASGLASLISMSIGAGPPTDPLWTLVNSTGAVTKLTHEEISPALTVTTGGYATHMRVDWFSAEAVLDALLAKSVTITMPDGTTWA